MNLIRRAFTSGIVFLSLLLIAQPVLAVIQVDLPVSKRFSQSRAVFVGKVAKVGGEGRVIDATLDQTFKGDGPATFRVQFHEKLTNAPAGVAVGQPVVVFAGAVVAIVHVGDAWLKGQVIPGATARYLMTQVDPTGHRDFPGTTAALMPVIAELKTGKSTLIDAYKDKPFTAGAKEIGKLDVSKPTFMLAIDVNGDGKPDLLVGTATGIKLFLATGNTYADTTEKWGLAGVTGAIACSGDVNGDGKIDLLIGATLYLNDGQKFTAAKQAIVSAGNATVLACALGDFTGRGKPDAALLLADGSLLTFKNGAAGAWTAQPARKLVTAGPAPQAAVFGDFLGTGKLAAIVVQENAITRFSLIGDEPPADFTRLTGDPLSQVKGFAGGMKNVSLTVIELNGDHRPDILLATDGAGLALINRGFGAYLADADVVAEISAQGLPFALGAARARAAVAPKNNGPDDLLVSGEDGKLFLLNNSGGGK